MVKFNKYHMHECETFGTHSSFTINTDSLYLSICKMEVEEIVRLSRLTSRSKHNRLSLYCRKQGCETNNLSNFRTFSRRGKGDEMVSF